MTKQINSTDIGTSIVDMQGRPTQAFFNLMQQLTNLEILNGEGSPEGVVKAPVKTLYADDNGATGSILYIKRTNADEDTGWVLL